MYEPENPDYDDYLFFSSMRITFAALIPFLWMVSYIVLRFGVGMCGGWRASTKGVLYKSRAGRATPVVLASVGMFFVFLGTIFVLIGTLTMK